MDDDFYLFRIGSFECVALCDGGAQYYLVRNASPSEIQAYLQWFRIEIDPCGENVLLYL